MKLKYYAFAALTAAMFSSCSDEFLQEKQNYEQTNEAAYNFFSGASGRVADAYKFALPDPAGSAGWQYPSTGRSDGMSQCTEEYSGFGTFVDPEKERTAITGNTIPDYFQGTMGNIQQNCWGRIRNINDIIRGISGSTLTQEEKDQLLGQVYFLRAWCYYLMFRWYGGIPIITEVQDPVATSITPRSTAKECFEFICEDLDRSAEMLAPFTATGAGWSSSDSYGRVTSGTALALKGRLMVLWASPLFNRANDQARWQAAYEVIKESLPVMASCGYALAHEGNPGKNASNWANMFVEDANPEAVFVTICNKIVDAGSGPDYRKNNTWEHGIRPSNAMGGGGMTPTANMVDLFPMADGKRPSSYTAYTSLDASGIAYDGNHPYMNRDPRFYRTFAFPGVRWAFNGDPRNKENYNPYKGDAYELWNYVWYESAADRDNIESGNTYGPDNLLGNVKGMYIRKRTDDLDINSNCRYTFETTGKGFTYSATPYMEIRFAEVLLNYAEAACMAGHPDVAFEQLKRIRSRVYDSSVANYGLQPSIASDQAACMAAILYERQVELAYEGKRFEDTRRWMLYDGGAGKVEGAPQTWTLTGWGGNTCTWLGFKPLNGTRCDNMEFRVKNDYNDGLGDVKWGANGENPDPLKDVVRPAGVDLREDLAPQFVALNEFYDTYLQRKKKKGDGYNSDHIELYMNFLPRYYILGFNGNIMNNNPSLLQTIGWEDDNNGGAPGTFDPLAE